MNPHRHPTTLRALAGRGNDVPLLDDAILIVIDAQIAYSARGDLPVEAGANAMQRIADLLERARNVGSAIVHVAHLGASGSPFDPLHGGRFVPQAAPHAGEALVRKTLPNAFAGTDLLERARSYGSRPIVLCGFMTHMCVSSTARAALDLGFETVVAGDATATRDLPAGSGPGVVPASAVQEATLAALGDRFSVIATTRQLLHGCGTAVSPTTRSTARSSQQPHLSER